MDVYEYDFMIGKTIVDIAVDNREDEIFFRTEDGEVFKMYHRQDCCESVVIEEIIGDLEDLLGSPITMAEETIQQEEDEYSSTTWTFYKFATNKGYVTMRWCGSSNGYYSESVNLVKLDTYDFDGWLNSYDEIFEKHGIIGDW